MRLEIRDLEMIRIIHEEGTLTGAAPRLFMSQPAVSRRLAKLEHRLGAKLFRRRAEGVTVTAEGRRVLESAERVLGEVARAEEEVRLLAQGQLGTIRVTTGCYMCYHWLPAIANAYARRYPRIELQLVPEATQDPFGALERSAADVALVFSRPPVADSFEGTEIFRDELIALVAARHPLAEAPYLAPEHFASEVRLCHYAEPGRGILELEFLEPAGVRPKRTMELVVTPAVVEMARAGFGVAVVPRWILESVASLEDLRVLRLGEGGLWRTWYATWLRFRSDEPALAALVQVLRRELEDQRPAGEAPRDRVQLA